MKDQLIYTYNIHEQAAIFETGAFNNNMRWYFYHSILLYLSQGKEGFHFFSFDQK